MRLGKRNRATNVLLTTTELDQLRQLARELDCSVGQAIRQAVKRAWTMHVACHPLCANGQPCFVPHLHADSLLPKPQPQQLDIPTEKPTE